MTGEDLNWFQIAVRILFLAALLSYVAVASVRLLRRLGGLIRNGPRVVRLGKSRALARRR
ncbi:cadmium ABC transporter ATPase [Rhodopseudomonas sp. WA056]|uniref:cadmium ABC transporter ATPase n=1 Tax=Rhodopseudomonas TaxID=1073 RepID=UPI00115EF2B9|nr:MULTISPECIES: cadmium ABC transporter ATPase [Rhodopseudomonas]NEW88337.1 cadmium ABC transporter ATPase [Rhodopseudomonas sp. WA056]QDL99003.1 cadmium ABC transporter ATPase [Rhodopseudomonas palustris]